MNTLRHIRLLTTHTHMHTYCSWLFMRSNCLVSSVSWKGYNHSSFWCRCVCARVCLQVTALRSGPAQHGFDFPNEITSCTCTTWTHTHCVWLGLFVSHITQTVYFSITAETKGKISAGEGGIAIIDFSQLPLFSSSCSHFFLSPTQLFSYSSLPL